MTFAIYNVNTGEIDLGGGSDGVNLVDALDGDTVDLVGSGDEEESGLESLEEDNSLASISAGEEDKNAAGGDAGADFGSFLNLSSAVS